MKLKQYKNLSNFEKFKKGIEFFFGNTLWDVLSNDFYLGNAEQDIFPQMKDILEYIINDDKDLGIYIIEIFEGAYLKEKSLNFTEAVYHFPKIPVEIKFYSSGEFVECEITDTPNTDSFTNCNQISLRDQFKREEGISWKNDQGEPDIDYVLWLEKKLNWFLKNDNNV